MKSKEIKIIIKIAKAYVEAGAKVGQAISMAQKDYREVERDKYEK